MEIIMDNTFLSIGIIIGSYVLAVGMAFLYRWLHHFYCAYQYAGISESILYELMTVIIFTSFIPIINVFITLPFILLHLLFMTIKVVIIKTFRYIEENVYNIFLNKNLWNNRVICNSCEVVEYNYKNLNKESLEISTQCYHCNTENSLVHYTEHLDVKLEHTKPLSYFGVSKIVFVYLGYKFTSNGREKKKAKAEQKLREQKEILIKQKESEEFLAKQREALNKLKP